MADQSKPQGGSIEKQRMPKEALDVYMECAKKARDKCEHHSSKPWDFKIDSEDTVPRIFRQGKELTLTDGYGIVDFRMHWHTRESLADANSHSWELLTYEPSEEELYVAIYSRFTGDHEMSRLVVPDDIKTCEEAERWIKKSAPDSNGKSLGELTMHLNLDCSEALKGLKAVQRAARKATEDLTALRNAMADQRLNAEFIGHECRRRQSYSRGVE